MKVTIHSDMKQKPHTHVFPSHMVVIVYIVLGYLLRRSPLNESILSVSSGWASVVGMCYLGVEMGVLHGESAVCAVHVAVNFLPDCTRAQPRCSPAPGSRSTTTLPIHARHGSLFI